MARGESSADKQKRQQSTTTFKESQGVFNNANAQSNQLYNELHPQLSAEATDPQGYSDTDLNAMNTASLQTLGGGVSAAKGEGDLAAARTRNKGGFVPAMKEAVLNAGRTASQNALGIQKSNAQLKEVQKQTALAQLLEMMSGKQRDTMTSLGLGNQSSSTLPGGTTGYQQFLSTLKALQG